MKRRKLTRRGSRRLFARTAMNIKKKNYMATPMRGGFRI